MSKLNEKAHVPRIELPCPFKPVGSAEAECGPSCSLHDRNAGDKDAGKCKLGKRTLAIPAAS